MAGLWILFFIFLGIFFWTMLPSPIIDKSFPVNFNQSILQNQNCRIDRTFQSITFHTKYPKFFYFGEWATYEIFVQKEFIVDGSLADDCMHAFEMRLEMDDTIVELNNRAIQPAVGSNEQIFIFEIKPVDPVGKPMGSLWVYMNSKTKAANSENRLPLFVIPVEFEMRSLFGTPILWIRLASITAGFLLIVVMILIHKTG